MTPEPVEQTTRVFPTARGITPVQFGIWPPAQESYNHIAGEFVRALGNYADLHAFAWYQPAPNWDTRNAVRQQIGRLHRELRDNTGRSLV